MADGVCYFLFAVNSSKFLVFKCVIFEVAYMVVMYDFGLIARYLYFSP